MALEIPTRKIDNKTTVYATNTRIFDAPIIQERDFDYDDLEGVIDDLDNPYDQTEPVTVIIDIPIKRKSPRKAVRLLQKQIL